MITKTGPLETRRIVAYQHKKKSKVDNIVQKSSKSPFENESSKNFLINDKQCKPIHECTRTGEYFFRIWAGRRRKRNGKTQTLFINRIRGSLFCKQCECSERRGKNGSKKKRRAILLRTALPSTVCLTLVKFPGEKNNV